jgi:acyl dehydratase
MLAKARHGRSLDEAEHGTPSMTRYLEDYAVGQTYGSGRIRLEEERIRGFAAEFDPQPFHMDAAAAAGSLFNGLAASGWHTAAITMRLMVEGDLQPAGGIVGTGFEELRWLRPVRPGDELHVVCEVLETRPSRSRPELGLLKLKTTTLNQSDEPVQVIVGTLLVQRRPKWHED